MFSGTNQFVHVISFAGPHIEMYQTVKLQKMQNNALKCRIHESRLTRSVFVVTFKATTSKISRCRAGPPHAKLSTEPARLFVNR